MINITVILENVPSHLLNELQQDIDDVQGSYCIDADATINKDTARVCLDIETDAHSVPMGIQNTIDMLDDMGLGNSIIEMEIF